MNRKQRRVNSPAHFGISRRAFLSLLAGNAFAAAAARDGLTTAQAIYGTWVLQQVGSASELDRILPTVLASALDTPAIRGFSLRVPWKAIAGDFSVLEAGLKIARARRLAFSLRFMAGRHTPATVFEEGSRFYVRGATQEKVPAPFMSDGSPNAVFEKDYRHHVERLAAWCRARGVRLLHLAWYGQDWAELNHGKEVRALPGYTYANWLNAHLRLLDIGLSVAGDDLAVEFPFSGYGALTDAASAFADHVVEKIGPSVPRFFCQANGWGPAGEWGAPNPQTEAAFDRVWARPICRGLQMIQPNDYDWPKVFERLYDTRATYGEVYAPSFTKERKDLLAAEIKRFAEHCRKQAPLPGG